VQRPQTKLDGPILIAPRVIRDERGSSVRPTAEAPMRSSASPRRWCRTITHARARGSCGACTFRSGKGQPCWCAAVAVRYFDVVVDLRRGSPTFGEWEGFHLNEDNMHIFYCSIGFAHGFCVLSDVADVLYKQSNYYAGEAERGSPSTTPPSRSSGRLRPSS